MSRPASPVSTLLAASTPWVRIAGLGLLLGGTAHAQDEVRFELGWRDGVQRRVVEQWEAEILGPDGERRTMSGTVRGVWTWDREGGDRVLTLRQPVSVRFSPVDDPLAQQTAEAMVTRWVVRVDDQGNLVRDGGSGPPLPSPSDTVVVPDPAQAPEAEVPAPTDAVRAEPMAGPTMSLDDVPDLLRGDAADRLERGLLQLAGRSLVVGRDTYADAGLASPSTGEVEVGEVLRRVETLAFCPDTGPGTDCVDVTLVRVTGGSGATGGVIAPGGRRTVEVWTVEPSTLLPHAARSELITAWEGPDGVWRLRATRTWQFMPQR